MSKKKMLTLHKYFLNANAMRKHFYARILQKDTKDYPTEAIIYMSLWYGCLYVVIEGWKRLNLENAEINNLLKSKNVSSLKQFRHTVFHFRPDYFDQDVMAFLGSDDNPVNWVCAVHDRMSDYFLEWFKNQKKSVSG